MHDLQGERPTSGREGATGSARQRAPSSDRPDRGGGASSGGLPGSDRYSVALDDAEARHPRLHAALEELAVQLGPGVAAHGGQIQVMMQEGLISLVEVGEGQRIWRAGDPAALEVVCVSGLLKLMVSGRVARLVLAGEQGGSNFLLPGGRHFGSLVAATDSVVLRVERAAIERWMGSGPEAANSLLRYQGLMFDRLQRQLCALTEGAVSARLARLLLLLVSRTPTYAERGLELPLTQAELAGLIGARRETVARQLSQWRRKGVLSFERGEPWMVNLVAVEAEADGPELAWAQLKPRESFQQD